MKTRYTVQYWYIDEHDTLERDFDTLKEARRFANALDKMAWKDIDIYARHYNYVREPLLIDDEPCEGWFWKLVDDGYYKDYKLV
jgi:hypothetical protein